MAAMKRSRARVPSLALLLLSPRSTEERKACRFAKRKRCSEPPAELSAKALAAERVVGQRAEAADAEVDLVAEDQAHAKGGVERVAGILGAGEEDGAVRVDPGEAAA